MGRNPYPTDLTDAQREIVRSAMPGAKNGLTGTPRRYPLREIWNAIFYHAKNGGTWRALPHDFPPWPAVWQQYRRWRDNGTLETAHEALRLQARQKEGRRAQPSAAILDSQSVRVAEKGHCWGFGAGKRITRRKRHLLVDTLGPILAVVITAASVQDRDGGRRVLEQVPEVDYPELLTVFADAGYQGRLEHIALEEHSLELVIVPRLEGQRTFVVLPKRWIVERTFAWLMRYRRLRADYETGSTSSRGWILAAAIHRMARRLAL